MDVSALLITNPESPLLEEPCEDAFDDGTMLAQAASVFGVPSRDPGDMILLCLRGLRILSSAS